MYIYIHMYIHIHTHIHVYIYIYIYIYICTPSRSDDVLGPARQDRRGVLPHRGHEPLPRLRALPADVRAQDEVGAVEERAVRRHGLLLLDVEGRAGDGAHPQLPDEVLLLDDAPAGAVDEEGARLHSPEALGLDQVPGRGHERAVQRDEVALREQRVERDPLHVGALAGEGVVGEDAEAERLREVHQRQADFPAADDAQHRALRLAVGQVVHHRAAAAGHPRRQAAPLAPLQPPLEPEHGAGEVQHVGHGQGGDGLAAVLGDVAHHDAARPRGLDVDAVAARARLADGLDRVREPRDEVGPDGQLLGDQDGRPPGALEDLLGGAVVVPLFYVD